MNIREIRRQSIHFTGIFIAFLTWYIPTYVLAALAFGGVGLMYYVRMHAKHARKSKDLLDGPVGYLMSFERKGAEPFMGVIMFLIGTGIILTFVTLAQLDVNIAAVSITVLSVGDSVSTIAGVHKGRHKIHYNRDKSYQGLFAGFIAASLACMIFVPWQTAVLAGAVGLIVESLPLPIDDNLAVPISVALILSIIPLIGF